MSFSNRFKLNKSHQPMLINKNNYKYNKSYVIPLRYPLNKTNTVNNSTNPVQVNTSSTILVKKNSLNKK